MARKYFFATLVVLPFILFSFSTVTFARGGGGGSSGGSSGGGSFSSGSSHSSPGEHGSSGTISPLCSPGVNCLYPVSSLFFIYLCIFLLSYYRQKDSTKVSPNTSRFSVLTRIILLLVIFTLVSTFFPFFTLLLIPISLFIALHKVSEKEARENAFLLEGLSKEKIQEVTELFTSFQNAWSSFDFEKMKQLTTAQYYERMALELSVLQLEKRKNLSEDISVDPDMSLLDRDDSWTRFSVSIMAVMKDSLIDVETGETLFRDNNGFTEVWDMVYENGTLKLSNIHQEKEDQSVSPLLRDWANQNAFFFNPDFGWLMLPNKGALFEGAVFGKTDINNHCIKNYKNSIVELYSMKSGFSEYLIGQAVLPKEYKNIVIRRKGGSGKVLPHLEQRPLESILFNNEFEVYCDPSENIETLELLNPAFMEYIMGLPFELNLEIAGRFVYFYTKEIDKADYGKILEVISKAFEEMKM